MDHPTRFVEAIVTAVKLHKYNKTEMFSCCTLACTRKDGIRQQKHIHTFPNCNTEKNSIFPQHVIVFHTTNNFIKLNPIHSPECHILGVTEEAFGSGGRPCMKDEGFHNFIEKKGLIFIINECLSCMLVMKPTKTIIITAR